MSHHSIGNHQLMGCFSWISSKKSTFVCSHMWVLPSQDASEASQFAFFLYLRKGLSKCVWCCLYIFHRKMHSSVVLTDGNIITLEAVKYHTDHELCRRGLLWRYGHTTTSFWVELPCKQGLQPLLRWEVQDMGTDVSVVLVKELWGPSFCPWWPRWGQKPVAWGAAGWAMVPWRNTLREDRKQE